MSLRDSYNVADWAKAAKNCQQVHNDLRRWFPNLCFPLGHGALSSKEELGEHDKAEPDIFATFIGVTIAGIEVTGTDRINCPSEVWVGHHKINYAKSANYPIFYVLFYPDRTRLVSAEMIMQLAPEVVTKEVRGKSERYHILNTDKTADYEFLKVWLDLVLTEHLRKLGYVRR